MLMSKNCVLVAVAVTLVVGMSQRSFGDILSTWTFQTTPPTTSGPHTADSGLFAASSFASTNSGGAISSPAGNGSSNSFSSNGWAAGEYYQFTTNTVGFDAITVSYAQATSNTGPRDFQFQFSTDGTNFTNFGAGYIGPTADFSSTLFRPENVLSFDLSGITELNNSSLSVFRIAVVGSASENNGIIASGGTFRVDDFTVNGTSISAVPEPTSLALLSVAGFAGLAVSYRRRKAKKSAAV
jgi:hypothetical protein